MFQETTLTDAYIVDIRKFEDERGFFTEAWKHNEAEKYGINEVFNRTNISHNRKAGTVRGLHSQRPPYAEAKLVRCIQGAIFDVIVDIRPDSPTYLQWLGVELSAANFRALYVPRGFLHGFQTLMDDTTVFYQVAGEYKPDQEVGACYNDPTFSIEWPEVGQRTFSDKDQNWPLWQVEARR